MTRGLFALALLLLAVGSAHAHTRSQSHSTWVVEGNTVRGVVTLTARDITRLPEAATEIELLPIAINHAAQTVSVTDANGVCAAGEIVPLASEPGYLRLSVDFECDATPCGLSIELLRSVAASHLHVARVRWAATGRESELLYAAADTTHSLAPQPDGAAASNFSSFVWLGVDHIATGYDHLAFLLALLIGAVSWRQLVLLVTGFTIGHSITLSLAALGWVAADTVAVEALIGFTIALVAAENLDTDRNLARPLAIIAVMGLLLMLVVSGLPPVLLVGLAVFTACYLLVGKQVRQQAGQKKGPDAIQLRPALTVLFGLIHGFGFAGVLTRLGIPDDRLVPALLGFNLGVELGQLALVIAAALLAVLLLRRLPGQVKAWAVAGTSAALLGLGLFWFVCRAIA